MDENTCRLCYAHGPDKRTVVMSCFYDLTEAVPEFEELGGVYRLRICKTCRSELLIHLQDWGTNAKKKQHMPKDSDGYIELDDPDRNIPIRVFGGILMLTKEEYDKWRKTDGPD